MRISFDFDGTLNDVEQMQHFASLFLKTDAEIFILTARYESYFNKVVYELAEKLGIKKENVLICDGRPKIDLIIQHKITAHFDDDTFEVDQINDRPELGCCGILINFKLMEVLNNNHI